MRKKFVYRKFNYEDESYYQLYRIVDEDTELDIINNEPGEEIEEFWRYAEYDDESFENDFLNTIYSWNDDKELYFLDDPFLITKLQEVFYEHFRDFDIVPKNKFNVEKINNLVNENVLYQDEMVNETLNIIKSNLDILDSNLSDYEKKKMKQNIVLFGPAGFGKTTFAKTVMENAGIPSALIELSEDPNKNLNLVISALGSSAMGNMKKAEHGVVFIKDNFDELGDILNDGSDDYLEPLTLVEALLESKNAYLGKEQRMKFDLSKITYVLIKNTPNHDVDSLYNEGMSPRLYDYFKQFICFRRLSKEEIKEIILNNPESTYNMYQKVCASTLKGLVVEPDFLDTLIERAYYDVGGIQLINNYIESMIKSRWGNNPIILDKNLVIKEVEDTSYLKDYMEKGEYTEEHYVDENKGNDELEKEEVNSLKFEVDLVKLRRDYQEKLPVLLSYVKGQDNLSKKLLYKTLVNDQVQNSKLDSREKNKRINHILLRGEPGSGKSYIVGLIAQILGNKPFAEIDCKRYTEAGYIGKSVDDMLLKLYYAANGDLEKAQKGILFLDEFDKLADGPNDRSNVSRGAVQEALLKLLEGTVFDLEVKQGHQTEIINFDTRELSAIAAGAFEGLSKIRDARIKKGAIGFKSSKEQEETFVDKNYTSEDMQKFGMQVQLLRRFPVQYDLNALNKENYRDIMLNARESYFMIKKKYIEMLGVEVVYDEDFIEEFTNKVSKLGYGASGIDILTERIFSSFETKLLEDNYTQVILTKESVADPSKVILVLEQEKVLKKEL